MTLGDEGMRTRDQEHHLVGEQWARHEPRGRARGQHRDIQLACFQRLPRAFGVTCGDHQVELRNTAAEPRDHGDQP